MVPFAPYHWEDGVCCHVLLQSLFVLRGQRHCLLIKRLGPIQHSTSQHNTVWSHHTNNTAVQQQQHKPPHKLLNTAPSRMPAVAADEGPLLLLLLLVSMLLLLVEVVYGGSAHLSGSSGGISEMMSEVPSKSPTLSSKRTYSTTRDGMAQHSTAAHSQTYNTSTASGHACSSKSTTLLRRLLYWRTRKAEALAEQHSPLLLLLPIPVPPC
jgi:hypothetical protein